MGIIKELDISVANAIAAGEVVDRPSSAVKELCENSLDAGAKRITIEIKRGGVGLIRVTDDGCGMSPEDVVVAIKRNATSKISSRQDLDAITTFGFRGEALAAISSVSRLRIITKQKDKTGVILTADGGKVVSVEETGTGDGTTVMVEGLFANVPARLKFLKKDSVEASYVSSVCEKLALSNPGIAFTLISDGKIKFSTAGCSKLKDVIYAVLGRELANNMIKLDYSERGIEIAGYLGTPITARANRGGQIFFVNNRYIKSQLLSSALSEACVSYVPKEKFPCAVMFVNVHPAFVDVNVHPSKTEVRFSNERAVFDTVYGAVRSAIMSNTQKPELEDSVLSNVKYKVTNSFLPVDEQRPTIEERQVSMTTQTAVPKTSGEKTAKYIRIESAEQFESLVPPENNTHSTVQPIYEKTYTVDTYYECEKENTATVPPVYTAENIVQNSEYEKSEIGVATAFAAYDDRNGESMEETKEVREEREEKTEEMTEEKTEYRYVGELFGTYLMVEVGDIAYIIDKHAAHERIIFERLANRDKSRKRGSQMLMIPIELLLDSVNAEFAEEYREEITESGFNFVRRGNNISINEIPSGFSLQAARTLFESLCEALGQCTGSGEGSRNAIFEKALYQSSCKAAIKAGEINSEQALRELVDELMSCPNINYCPHGRPVAFVMKKSSVERRFGRA